MLTHIKKDIHHVFALRAQRPIHRGFKNKEHSKIVDDILMLNMKMMMDCFVV